MDSESPIFPTAPPGFRIADVSVRPPLPEERRRWDELMDRHHHLGFRRFPGRGLRCVFEWRKRWIGPAGRQAGASRRRPRDRWIGWSPDLRFDRLHPIGSNTRFPIPGAPGAFPNLASRALAAMTGRLSDGRRDACGHEPPVAETSVDPSRFSGGMYRPAGRRMPGLTKGFARSNGRCTEPHGVPKELHVTPLRRDALRRLRDPDPLPEPLRPDPMDGRTELPPDRLRPLHEALMKVADFRRTQGRRHMIAFVIAVTIAARLTGITSGIGAARFARALTQEQPAAPGAWREPGTGLYVPPSRSAPCRILDGTDPTEIEGIPRRRSVPRLRLGAGRRRKAHPGGEPLRGRPPRDRDPGRARPRPARRLPRIQRRGRREGGRAGAAGEVPLAGRVITVDALCTRPETPPAASWRPTGPTG